MPSIGSFGVAKRLVAEAENPPEPTTFEFEGHEFRIREGDPSAFPLMELADAAANGLDSGSMQGLAAMWRMLKSCLHPDDFPRFRQVAMDEDATTEDVLAIVKGVWEHLAGRPTKRPTGSPDGPQPTSMSSKAVSSSPGTDRPSGPSPTDPPPDDGSGGAPLSAPSPTDPRPDGALSSAPEPAAGHEPIPGWGTVPASRTDLMAPTAFVDDLVDV